MRLLLQLACLVVACGCTAIGGQSGPPLPPGILARLDCQGGAAFPLCGATRTVGNDRVGRDWTRTYVAAEQAIEVAIAPGSTGEGYYGWSFERLSAPAPGETRVIRVRLKPVGPIDWPAWGAKFVVLGDESGDDNDRVLSTMELYEGQPHLNVDKNINGFYASTPLKADAWHAIQIVIAPEAPGRSKYRFEMFVNGASVSRSRSFDVNPVGWREVGFGYYGQFANGAKHVRYRFKDAELGTAFDPNFR